MNMNAFFQPLRRVFAVGTFVAGLAFAASPAHATFTSQDLVAIGNAVGNQNIITASETSVEMVVVNTTNSLVGYQLSTAQASATQSSGFWSSIASKFKFANAGSRAAGGCFAGTVYGGLASRKQVTVGMKAARVITGCLAGVAAGPIAEFAAATVLVMGAPAWAAVGTGVLVTGLVTGGINLAADRLWFDKSAARRQLSIYQGQYIAPSGSEPAYTPEYATYGDQVTTGRHLPNEANQGTDVLDNNGRYIGTDTLGGSQGTRRNCAYTNQGYTCLQ